MGSTHRGRLRLYPGAWILLIVLTMSLGASGQSFSVAPADDPDPGQVLNVGVHPFRNETPTVVEDKVPLLEVFTATWCPPCAPAHGAVERLMAEKSPGLGAGNHTDDDAIGLALLSYHPFPDVGGEDPFGIPEGHNRLAKKHNVFWFPSAYVDGVLEDAPAPRSVAVDVGMEETLYNSYRNLIRSTQDNDPPFVITIESQQVDTDPATWEVNVSVEATRNIQTPLVMQGVLWEDHVAFPGSSGVDQHRMVVRAMAAPEQPTVPLQAGDIWRQTLHLVAPPAVNPASAGVSVIVEAEWGQERDERAGLFFGFALFVAGGTGAAAAWQIHTKNRRRSTRRDGMAKSARSASDEP